MLQNARVMAARGDSSSHAVLPGACDRAARPSWSTALRSHVLRYALGEVETAHSDAISTLRGRHGGLTPSVPGTRDVRCPLLDRNARRCPGHSDQKTKPCWQSGRATEHGRILKTVFEMAGHLARGAVISRARATRPLSVPLAALTRPRSLARSAAWNLRSGARQIGADQGHAMGKNALIVKFRAITGSTRHQI